MQTNEMVEIERRLFTVNEYDRFIEVGVLTEDDPVELINGEVVKMSPISSSHVGCVHRLNRLFSQRLSDNVILHIQNPIHVDRYSEPEPDVVVLKYRDDYYSDSLPRPTDVLLLIEVAETSLSYDRRVKVPLYAKAGIQEVWVVNVEEKVIYGYRNPGKGKYQETSIVKPGETLTLTAFPEIVLQVGEII